MLAVAWPRLRASAAHVFSSLAQGERLPPFFLLVTQRLLLHDLQLLEDWIWWLLGKPAGLGCLYYTCVMLTCVHSSSLLMVALRTMDLLAVTSRTLHRKGNVQDMVFVSGSCTQNHILKVHPQGLLSSYFIPFYGRTPLRYFVYPSSIDGHVSGFLLGAL